MSDLTRAARTVIARLAHPRRTVRALRARLLPKDRTAVRVSAWRHGKLPRVPLTEVIEGLQMLDVTLLRVFDRAEDISLDREELLALASMVKATHPTNILEIGTYDGNTTLNLAANAPAEAVVTTVDLPLEWSGRLVLNVPKAMTNVALKRPPVGWQYQGSQQAGKIRQILCDSAELDWERLPGPFDFIFIDGCHHYLYVAHDTAEAVRHVKRRGGLIVWHDYGYIEDVSRVVDQLASEIPIRVVQGTRLAVARF